MEKKEILNLSQLIEKHVINKAFLASKMPMPKGTFNNKLSEKLTQYHFTENETERLKEILRDMAADIDKTCERHDKKH